jgi:hypothetical protein
MSSTQRSAVKAPFAESAGELSAERGVVGAQPGDLVSCRVEALAL